MGARCIGLQVVGDAIQSIHVGTYTHGVKLDMALALLRNGWTQTARPLHSYACDEPRLFINKLRTPSRYIRCLPAAQDLFVKCLVLIAHNWTDSQYQCLLRTSDDKLHEFLTMHSGIPYDAWCCMGGGAG